jgi:hypothetical protein
VGVARYSSYKYWILNLIRYHALTTRDLGTANAALVVQFMQDLKLLLGNPDLLLDD